MDSSGRCISTGVHFLSFLPSAEGKQVFTGFHTFRTFVVRGLVLHTACLSSGPISVWLRLMCLIFMRSFVSTHIGGLR